MEGPITVKELLGACQHLVQQGLGDKGILISSDDEGNEFHTLQFAFTTDLKTLTLLRLQGMFHDNNDPKDIVILG